MSENKNAKTPTDGPVAWGCQCGRSYTVTCISSKPAKQWVGLTDEEIDYQAKKDDHAVYFVLGALWAEAKLKEKNHG